MEQNNDIVELFPYKIKNVKNFHHRDHPKDVNPLSPKYTSYWGDFMKKSIEGHWVNDEGTWVFMMPKLFFYTNYVIIVDKKRHNVHPTLRDNEWIIFTYHLCTAGFSGFEFDKEFTCHEAIGRYEIDPDLLDQYDIDNLPKNVFKDDGSYKKYIDPWTYLTRHYLIDNPAKEPLGKALYDNPLYNFCVLSGRGVGKSFSVFTGIFLHEFVFSGIRDMSELRYVNRRMLFGLGSGDTRPLKRSINNVKSAYNNMPGQYKFKDKKKQNILGAFYKRLQGSWEVGKEIEHIVKSKKGTVETQGSSIQMVALTVDRENVGAGDRFRYIIVEEFGFLSNAIAVHTANKDSLQSEGERVGQAFYLGTSGDMEAIKEPKEMFENPEAYDIFGIPNYWKNLNKKIALFIPATYGSAKHKDPNGNTKVEDSYNAIMAKRAKDLDTKDSLSIERDIMFNPVNPDEMLRPGNSSGLPKQEAQLQINRIEAYDVFAKKAQVGRLFFDPTAPTGVGWEKDMTMKPIINIKIDDQTTNTNKDGAVIIYEQPPLRIPDNLYWVVYDPAAKSGDGESFHSVIVYKHFYSGVPGSLEDNIVAEWIGRKERLDDNYYEVIKLAKYFNARIFPEVNVAGFVEWCGRTSDYWKHLESDAYYLEQEIHQNKNISRNYYKVGTQMNDRKKTWALKKFRDWLLEPKDHDPITGIPRYRTIDQIYSVRLLNEIVAFTNNKKDNFDHVSSMLLLMLLIGKLDGLDLPKLGDDYDEDPVPNYEQYITKPVIKRASILNY